MEGGEGRGGFDSGSLHGLPIYLKIHGVAVIKKWFVILCVSFFSSLALGAEESGAFDQKLSLWTPLTSIPQTSWSLLRESFRKEAIDDWALILSSTALLYQYDEEILLAAQADGRRLGIGNHDGTKPLVYVFGLPLRFPTDTGSALYFLGDGITNFVVAGSLFSYGYFSHSNRPFNTAVQIIHGMAVSTLFNQFLKWGTGRESPLARTEPRGAWRPFPPLERYTHNTAAYDAVPSGHMMTATLTFTILRENYPEYEKLSSSPTGGLVESFGLADA